MRNKSPKQLENAARQLRLGAYFAGSLFAFYLVASFFFGEMGLVRYMKLRDQKTQITAEISSLRASNEELRKRVQALRTDPESIELLARERGLVKEGETVYQYENE